MHETGHLKKSCETPEEYTKLIKAITKKYKPLMHEGTGRVLLRKHKGLKLIKKYLKESE